MGGCSTPISALAQVVGNEVVFCGNILTVDGAHKKEVNRRVALSEVGCLGQTAAMELLEHGGQQILNTFKGGK